MPVPHVAASSIHFAIPPACSMTLLACAYASRHRSHATRDVGGSNTIAGRFILTLAIVAAARPWSRPAPSALITLQVGLTSAGGTLLAVGEPAEAARPGGPDGLSHPARRGSTREAGALTPVAVKFVQLRLGVIGHVLAYEAQATTASEVLSRGTVSPVSKPEAERLPARLVLALRRAPERAREGDLCEVALHESDAPALTKCLRQLASLPGVSAIERDRYLEAVTAVDSASAR
jgi:hypothetical protein